jgi:hypothetical protein
MCGGTGLNGFLKGDQRFRNLSEIKRQKTYLKTSTYPKGNYTVFIWNYWNHRTKKISNRMN